MASAFSVPYEEDTANYTLTASTWGDSTLRSVDIALESMTNTIRRGCRLDTGRMV